MRFAVYPPYLACISSRPSGTGPAVSVLRVEFGSQNALRCAQISYGQILQRSCRSDRNGIRSLHTTRCVALSAPLCGWDHWVFN